MVFTKSFVLIILETLADYHCSQKRFVYEILICSHQQRYIFCASVLLSVVTWRFYISLVTTIHGAELWQKICAMRIFNVMIYLLISFTVIRDTGFMQQLCHVPKTSYRGTLVTYRCPSPKNWKHLVVLILFKLNVLIPLSCDM